MMRKIQIVWEIRDRYGQLKSYERKEVNSLVMNFVDLLCVQFDPATNQSITDVGGTSRVVADNAISFNVNAAANDGLFGLVVGTGTNAVALGNTALQTKIDHGSAGGQLNHGTVIFSAPTTVSTTRKFTVQRTFTNNSGGNITVKEIGIYAKAGATGWYFLIERALSTKTINNGTSGTLTYTIGVTV